MKGNTVGSRPNVEWAYIAGFIDGDGSMMLQLKKRSDTKRGFRFMATICIYQDSRHDKPLYWMQNVFGIGYISKRKDAITELRVNGFDTVERILTQLEPYIRFKTVQLQALKKACSILRGDTNKLTKDQLLEVVECKLAIQNENYKSHHKKSREEILKTLGLTP